MKTLYNIIESILGSDEKIIQDLAGDEATAKLHYDLFMDCVGDLLYSQTFYQNFISYSGEINFLIKDQTRFIDFVYTQFDKVLNKYFKELKRIYSYKNVSWIKKYETAAIAYHLTLTDKKTKEEQKVTFKIVNRRDNRLVRVMTTKNKPFMLP